MAFKERKFVFEDEEGIIESNVYYARPNKAAKDEEGNPIMKNGKPLFIEDNIIPFLRKEGYVEVIDGKKQEKAAYTKEEETEVDF